MGLALSNPNDRRRLNAGARAVVKHGASVNDVVGMIVTKKSAKQIKQAYDFYIPAKDPAKKAALSAAVAAGPQSKATKKKYNTVKDQIAMGLQKAGYGKPATRYSFGKAKTTSYSKRLRGSKSGRYYLNRKKNNKYTSTSTKPTGRQPFGRDKPYSTLDVTSVREFNTKRVKRRAAGISHQKGWAEQQAAWKASKPKRSSGRKGGGGLKMYQAAVDQLMAAGLERKQATAMLKQGKAKGMSAQQVAGEFVGSMQAAANPRVFGGLALSNPNYKSLAVKGAVAMGLAGAGVYVHLYAVPWVSENVYSRIPGVVGETLDEYAYAATGLIAGMTLGGLAGYLAVKGQTTAGMYVGLIAGGVAAAGGALQVAEMTGILGDTGFIEDEELEPVDEELAGVFGGIAMDNGDMHGIAMDNTGVFGGIALDNYGDGMAYELGGFSSPFDDAASAYGSAELADAQHAGADLDVAEGQAAVAGPKEWMNRFGHPPVRVSAMGGQSGAASHLAGRRGHRWGWLIKLIGFKKFQKLAALPPEKRLSVLKKMRRAAIRTLKREMKNKLPVASPEFVSGQTATMADTAPGLSTSYGGMLFSGQNAM
ncbi:MAG: hypothetical protein CMD33_01050 [Flavobacteriales bacterium]|nr:hypothetical protein [Flavobacteriales bacterium]